MSVDSTDLVKIGQKYRALYGEELCTCVLSTGAGNIL